MSTIAAQLPNPTPVVPVPNLPPPSGRLTGVLLTTFTGNRSQSKKFMLEGDAVDDWTMEQIEWLNDRITAGTRTTDKDLWDVVAQRFRDAFTDGQAKQKAALFPKHTSSSHYLHHLLELIHFGHSSCTEYNLNTVYSTPLPMAAQSVSVNNGGVDQPITIPSSLSDLSLTPEHSPEALIEGLTRTVTNVIKGCNPLNDTPNQAPESFRDAIVAPIWYNPPNQFLLRPFQGLSEEESHKAYIQAGANRRNLANAVSDSIVGYAYYYLAEPLTFHHNNDFNFDGLAGSAAAVMVTNMLDCGVGPESDLALTYAGLTPQSWSRLARTVLAALLRGAMRSPNLKSLSNTNALPGINAVKLHETTPQPTSEAQHIHMMLDQAVALFNTKTDGPPASAPETYYDLMVHAAKQTIGSAAKQQVLDSWNFEVEVQRAREEHLKDFRRAIAPQREAWSIELTNAARLEVSQEVAIWRTKFMTDSLAQACSESEAWVNQQILLTNPETTPCHPKKSKWEAMHALKLKDPAYHGTMASMHAVEVEMTSPEVALLLVSSQPTYPSRAPEPAQASPLVDPLAAIASTLQALVQRLDQLENRQLHHTTWAPPTLAQAPPQPPPLAPTSTHPPFLITTPQTVAQQQQALSFAQAASAAQGRKQSGAPKKTGATDSLASQGPKKHTTDVTVLRPNANPGILTAQFPNSRLVPTHGWTWFQLRMIPVSQGDGVIFDNVTLWNEMMCNTSCRSLLYTAQPTWQVPATSIKADLATIVFAVANQTPRQVAEFLSTPIYMFGRKVLRSTVPARIVKPVAQVPAFPQLMQPASELLPNPQPFDLQLRA
ncbi:hypothetical protein B0F90DRAFT_1827900 [Multifurca ochricompacta]|uniref:Uncharacterized protein n=1 Tax=Multifurca ochricompacta TaxID=376703 RepID=A0AAD4QIF5_9AGAM|nr:hypothetical protein B0F90DRAFT_1827900 [Multifurca ochricompacta]